MDFLKVADHMDRHPVTFEREMTLEAAVDRIVKSGKIGGPVVNHQQQVIGFLSEQDCLAKMLIDSYHDQMTAYVADVMRSEVVTVNADTSIIELAQLMLKPKPKLYPVVGDNQCLLGVISRSDVLRAIDLEMHSHYRKPC